MGNTTRSGQPDTELRPLRRPGLDRVTLFERWRHLPTVDAERFREDVGALFDCELAFDTGNLDDVVGGEGLEVVPLLHPDAVSSD